MKTLVFALAIIGLLARGYFVYQAGQAQKARQASQSVQITQIRRDMSGQGADANADAEAFGTIPGTGSERRSTPSLAKSAAPAATTPAATVATVAPPRAEIDAALKTLHLTTILPGAPGVVIIDRHEYAEGEEVPLPNGCRAKIVAVQDDDVQLTCGGSTFLLGRSASK